MVALGVWCDHIQSAVPTVVSGIRGCRVTVFPALGPPWWAVVLGVRCHPVPPPQDPQGAEM